MKHIYYNKQGATAATLGWSSWNTMNILLQQQRTTAETLDWSSWNTMNILLQQHITNCCNNRLKELKHLEHIIATTPNKLLQQIGWRSWNIWNILLQHWCEAYETTLEIKTLATTWNNYCNMRLKQLKHTATSQAVLLQHCKNICCNDKKSHCNIRKSSVTTS